MTHFPINLTMSQFSSNQIQRNLLKSVLILSLISLLPLSIEAESPQKSEFLSSQDLQKLSWGDRKAYLKDIYSILEKMDQRSQYIAQIEEFAKSRIPASVKDVSEDSEIYKIFAEVMAEVDALFKKAEASTDRKEKFALLKEAAFKLGEARYTFSTIPNLKIKAKAQEEWRQRMSKVFEQRRLMTKGPKQSPDDGKVFFSELKQLQQTDKVIKEVTRPVFLKFDADADTDKAKVEQLRDLSSYYKIDMVRLIAASKADTEEMSAIQGKRLNKEAPNSSKTTAEAPSPKEIEKPKFSDDEFFRCMYAGFILKSGPCRAPASLQEDLKEVPNLKCSSPQVLCNPLLFGAKTDCSPEVLVSARKDASVRAKCLEKVRPLCISRSRSATQDCIETSEKDARNLDTALLMIEANPEAWNNYTRAFQGLCDEGRIDQNIFANRHKQKEAILQDITQTCDWARAQLAKVKSKYQPTETNNKSQPESKSTPGDR